MKNSAFTQAVHWLSFGFAILIYCVAGWGALTRVEARTITLGLQFERQQYSTLDPYEQGNTYYTVNASLSSDIPPVTEDDVYSPNTNAYSASENGSGLTQFGDLASALNAATNGVWTLVVNQGDASQQIYTFQVSASGLSDNSFPAVQVTTPVDGSPAVSTNTSIVWSGPVSWDGVNVDVHNPDYSFYNGASFPATTTSWNPGTLPLDTNYAEVTYTTNATAYITISTPINNLSQPFTNWVSSSTLGDYAESGFVTSTNPAASVFGGHTLMAYYSFEDDNLFAHDFSGNGNDIDSYGDYSVSPYITNDAEAGSYAFGAAGDGWLYPPTNLLATLGGSFSVSLWLKTSEVEGNDYGDVYSAGGVISALGNQNSVMPMGITGSKLAFYTGGSSQDILHSQADVNTGQYVHVVVTRNQQTGEKDIYVNGVLDTSDFGSTDLLSDSSELDIGYNNGNTFTGEMDEIQIYSGVLSAGDVAFLYANPGQSVANVSGGDFNSALNTTNLNWITSGDTDWFTETTNTYDGVEAAQSGPVTGNQTSVLQTTVTGPGTLTFYWQSTADGYGDFDYEFDIDGNYADDLNYNQPWTQDGTFTIPAGQHTLTWTAYAYGDNDPTEAAYLDEVNFTPASTTVITVNPFNQTNYPGYNVALVAAATDGNTNDAITWQWYETGSGAIAGATSAAYYPTNAGTAGVAGNYYAIATTPAGSATTATATVTFVSAPLPPDWSTAFKSPFLPVNDTTVTRDYYYGCITDTNGNLYAAAEFGGNTEVGSLNLNSGTGGDAAAIVKQSPTGAPLWAVGITNNGAGNSFAECVAPAPGGGVYLLGNYSGDNWLGTNHLTDSGNGDIFIARFDANGSNLWVKTFGGTNDDFATFNQLTADPAGNVTLSGFFGNGPVTIGGTQYNLTGQEGILIQLNQTGNILWSQLTPGWVQSLTYSAGRLYASLNTTTTGGATNVFIGGTSNLTDRAWAIACLNEANGQAIWVHGVGGQYGGGNGNPYATGYDDDQPFLAAAGANVFATGAAYGSSATFGALTVNFGALRGDYLVRYDTNGNAVAANTYGSVTTSPRAIVANAQGDAYVSGIFNSYSFFGSNEIAAPVGIPSSVQNTGNSFNQSFLAKFDINGNALWGREAVSGNAVIFFGIALASDGVWASGWGISAQYPQSQYLTFGTNNFFSDAQYVSGGAGGSTSVIWYPCGVLGKVTDSIVAATPVSILSPEINGTNFQFSFVSTSGFTNAVQSCTNLLQGSWQPYTNFTGDGTLKTVLVPRNNPPVQFFRVTTQ